jgi:hypothetical protein
MGFDDANHQEPADRAEYEAWEAKEAIIRQRDEACAQVDKLKLQIEEKDQAGQATADLWAGRWARLKVNFEWVSQERDNALLQVDKYRAALEKILRLKDATPRTALDAVWIAKDALLGTNHMEKPVGAPLTAQQIGTPLPRCSHCGGDHLYGPTNCADKRKFCGKVVAINTMGEVYCGRPMPCDQHG